MNPEKELIFDLFNYQPHEGQKEIHECETQFRLVAGGAQGGKTKLAKMEAISGLLLPPKHEDVRAWVVGPTYTLADKLFFEIVKSLKKTRFWKNVDLNKADRTIEFEEGSWLQGKSADHPERLAAEELDFVIVDEGPRCKEDTFNYLLTRLITREGWLLSIGTPQGRNWFHNEWLKGQTGEDESTVSFSMPTNLNPYIRKAQIEILKQKMPERWYRQEIKGEFVEDATSVFQNVKGIVDEKLMVGLKYPGPHVIGIDVGKSVDFTVLIAANTKTKEICGYKRMQGNWSTQMKDIIQFCKYWNGGVFIDATAMSAGSFIAEKLRDKGIHTEGINITRLVKEELVSRLQSAIIDKAIRIPKIKQLILELEAFQYKRRGLTIRMEAPSGFHDDCVISLALCLHGLAKYSGDIHMSFR